MPMLPEGSQSRLLRIHHTIGIIALLCQRLRGPFVTG